MKFVKIKNQKLLEVSEIKEPILEKGNVLIDVKRCGICGSDIHNWVSGEPKGLVMGHEFSGVVVNPGDRKDLKIGDKVTALPISPCGKCEACQNNQIQYCPTTWDKAIGLSLSNPGALATRLSVRADMVLKVPDTMNDNEIAMIEPIAVSLHAIHLADIKPNDKVLVIGAGIIGLGCAMLAKQQKAGFIGISETNQKRGLKAINLDLVHEWYDAKEELVNKLMKKTKGGFDVVIECVGNERAVNSALSLVKPGGTVILVGVSSTPISIYSVLAVMKELTIKGSIAYTKEEFESCIHLIADKKVDVTKLIDDIVGLEDVQNSYEKLTSGMDDAIKILVDPNQ